MFDAFNRRTPLINPRDHCEFLNVCFPGNLPRTLPPWLTLPFTLPTLLPTVPARNLHRLQVKPDKRESDVRKADLSTAIKVVQITDVHLEDQYKEARICF